MRSKRPTGGFGITVIAEFVPRWLPALLPLTLAACLAEDIGVALPAGGEAAIQSADLQWDLWRITDPRLGGRVPGSSGARRVAKRIADRMAEASFGPGFATGYRWSQSPDTSDLVCGRKEGASAEAIVVTALDPGFGTLSAVPIAGLLALARAFDTPTLPVHTMVFCVMPEAGGIESYAKNPAAPLESTRAFFIIGSLTGQRIEVESGATVAGIAPVLLHSGPLASRLGDDMGRVRFGGLERRTRVAYSAVSALE
jgi:hypothetical protein